MKKLTAFVLIFALMLSLSGCTIGFTHEVYTRPEETMSTETFESDEVPALEAGTRHYLMEETVEDLSAGSVTRTEYIPGPEGGPTRIGLIVYENEVEVRREDWEPDARENILKNTVTVNGEVTEVWEYVLTYNANFDIDERVCTRNGQWLRTEDYIYQTVAPFRIRSVYIHEEGNDDPPWYEFSYKDGMVYSFGEYHAREPKDYGKSGYGVYSITCEYDDQGRLENRRVSEKNGGFYDVYYEKFAYEGNRTTVSRYEDTSDDLILRIEETYDEFGNLTLSEEYSPEGELLRRTAREYITVTAK